MDRIQMNISGMTCGHCVGAVSRALQSLPAVDVEQVTVGTATVSYDPTRTPLTQIVQAVEDEGYGVTSTPTLN